MSGCPTYTLTANNWFKDDLGTGCYGNDYKETEKYSNYKDYGTGHITVGGSSNLYLSSNSSSIEYIPYDTGTGINSSISNYQLIEDKTCDARNSTVYDFEWGSSAWDLKPQLSPIARLRQIIRERYAPAVISKRSLPKASDIREMRARQTLHRIVGDEQFRSFFKNGFITLKAKSGLVYQMFTGHQNTRVYKNGQIIEYMCIVLRGSFPPTDELIMRYLLLLNDEGRFCDVAVHSRPYQFYPKGLKIITDEILNNHGVDLKARPVDTRGLSEIFKELKSA